MAVEFINIGAHKNVYAVVFGHNDVLITQAQDKKTNKAMIIFHSADPETIKPEEFLNKYVDQLPIPDSVLVFEDPETIATLIQSLSEIQKMFF
jgi:hypothetical protein